jgi:flagellar FliJ protein
MTTQTSRFAPLLQLASQQEDRAARTLADALARHANAEDRRKELLQYQLEYECRSPGTGLGVQGLSRHSGFMAKLRDALQFQAIRTQELARTVGECREDWMAAHREVEKLAQLIAQATQQAEQHQQRRQDRELDERAMSRYHQRQAAA